MAAEEGEVAVAAPCWRDPWSASSAARRCCFRARPPGRPWWPGPPPLLGAQLPAPARCCPALRPALRRLCRPGTGWLPHVAKTMQKPCKMRRVQNANPPNPHSPPRPCYPCYMCYISQGKPLNIHSPRVPCYMCYMCYISQGSPLNIHSFRGSLLYVLYVLYGPI